MGYISCMSHCYGCKRLFTYNPNLVPSVPINGVREPICQSCVNIANPLRIAGGFEPIHVLPGAYEPGDESSIEF